MIWADMEGAAGIDDFRACVPAYPQYWETGRDALTDDVIAAAEGLLAGGATSVAVTDFHGPGHFKNGITERLPPDVELGAQGIQPAEFDAAFHVGFHARCGTADGFMSHTHVPEFRIKVNDALVTENHVLAWLAGVPVLGITGDRALQPELDGVLQGTPLFVVKNSTSRTETSLRYRDPGERFAAIRDFAAGCARAFEERSVPELQPDTKVIVSMQPRLIDEAAFEAHGLRRRSEATLTVSGNDWGSDIWPRVRIAAQAASWVLDEFERHLDINGPDDIGAADQNALQGLRDRFETWMQTLHPAWEE